MDVEHMRTRAAMHLRQAVQTMRDSCDRAERDLEAGDGTACQRVLHSFAWGFANASSSIETAMSIVEDAHIVSKLQGVAPARAPRPPEA